MNAEDLVSAYIAIRDERQKLLSEYEERDAVLKADLLKLEAALLDICNQVGADSLKVKTGTAMRRINERFFCSDWQNFYEFVMENKAPELLEKRIHQGNFKQFMTDHNGDGLPPGVSVNREYAITVRRASSGT